nr:MAG: hypothetical protein DIU74_01250 [Pseudomonadota bacterium]
MHRISEGGVAASSKELFMSPTIRFSAVLLLSLGLTSCGQEEAAPPQPETRIGSTPQQTPPGAAGDSAGNKAQSNIRDEVPTQQQLDPTPPANLPAGAARDSSGTAR